MALSRLFKFWKTFVVIAVPLIAIPIAQQGEDEKENMAFRCAYVMVIMASFWVTEALPLAITSLLPVALFPVFGIMTTDAVGREYFKETNMMFISGIFVAIAVEHCNLHKRVALRVLLLLGTSPRMLMLGFMLPTMFLSMWISNTATTAMMVPIVDAVLSELEKDEMMEEKKHESKALPLARKMSSKVFNVLDMDDKKPDKKIQPVETMEERMKRIRHMIFLSVAYAANTGGTGTLTGTGSNLILKSAVSEFGHGHPINFASWMQYATVPMLVNLLLCWLWLQTWYIGVPSVRLIYNELFKKDTATTEVQKEKNAHVKRVILREYDALGPITFHQLAVFGCFFTLILLWIFREPQFMPGWGELFHTKLDSYHKTVANCTANCDYTITQKTVFSVDDATAGMLIVIILFILPSNLSFWPFTKGIHVQRSPGLLDWQTIHTKMPWSLVFLLGGGFALAKATKISGLSVWLGKQLEVLSVMPSWAIVLVVCIGTAAATEITSNVATCSILMPVLKNLAISLHINPLYLMLPVALTCSYAFMLPVATPPNAIVYTASDMKMTEMMKMGFAMNIICVTVNVVCLQTYGIYLLDLDTYPTWADE